jgi:retron-type reverse transcriptase
LDFVIRQVIAERDDAPEDMTENYGFDYETDEFVYDIEKLLMQKEYTPVPYKGFIIKKRSGKGERLIEKLLLKDMVVQKILYQILYPVFDRAFEKSSSGYRKKRSSRDVIRKIREAITRGYEWVVESDIEDLFASFGFEDLVTLLIKCPGWTAF